jgi:HxlR-like helix-turn-helix protein
MAITHEKVRFLPKSKDEKLTPNSAADGVEQALKIEGRWKLVILSHLFGGKLVRFSDLEHAIPAISQKMSVQQLRQVERTGSFAGSFIITCAKGRIQADGLGTGVVPGARRLAVK